MHQMKLFHFNCLYCFKFLAQSRNEVLIVVYPEFVSELARQFIFFKPRIEVDVARESEAWKSFLSYDESSTVAVDREQEFDNDFAAAMEAKHDCGCVP